MSNTATSTDSSELRDIAERLAREAGQRALAGRRSGGGLGIDTKSSPSDLVTKYDREAEASIVGWLQQHRPTDGIVGEEGSSITGSSGLEWHIDPIDGTTNFVYDQPAWGCSIGVRRLDPAAAGTGDYRAGQTVAGAVYVPALDEMFGAAVGMGAHMNGRTLAVNPVDDVSVALVSTGFSFDADRRRVQADKVANLVAGVRDVRRLGAASVDLCFVACGRLDAYFEAGLNSWDMAAGELIATEAGALSTDFSGAPGDPSELLVAAPGVHRALMALLN